MMMKNNSFALYQRGATLMVGLIILVITTLMVISGFTLSGGNLAVVGNVQHRNEAIAAANMVIEQTIDLNLIAIDPANYPDTVMIDIDQDNVDDYVVTINQPICLKGTAIPVPLETSYGVNSQITSASDYQTLWEINVVAQNVATGASVTARQGINKRLSLAEAFFAACI